MAEKEDRRVLYTKMFLKEALLELMREKPVDRITPTELCRRAGINRNTFYSHFYSVRELLQNVEDEFEDQVIRSLSTKIQTGTVYDLLCEVCETLYKQKALCEILLSEHGDASFLEKVVGMSKSITLAEWQKSGMDLADDTYDMALDFVVEGSLAVLRYWAQNDMKKPPREIAGLIDKMSNGGISVFESYRSQ